jgi:hypothetical protein
MDLHALHDHILLAVHDEEATGREDLRGLLTDLSFERARAQAIPEGALVLSMRRSESAPVLPLGGRIVMQTNGLSATEVEEDVYVSDGASTMHVQPTQGRATAHIAPGFTQQPTLRRQQFWAFGLLRLLRQRGLYGLHAAGVETPGGRNLLIVGRSGCGKTTLAIGLVRSGAGYLSDDAVLLRDGSQGVEALAFRRPFSIDAARVDDYRDLVAPSIGSASGKRRVDMTRVHPCQHRQRFCPDVIVFPRIARTETSTLCRLSRSAALHALLAESGPELFDRSTMPSHLELLSRLLRQTTPYELAAGRDMYESPQLLIDLLEQSSGSPQWRESSSN